MRTTMKQELTEIAVVHSLAAGAVLALFALIAVVDLIATVSV